ncbi:hypothetical protein KFL_008790030, partial [Klebsormidium nitens]
CGVIGTSGGLSVVCRLLLGYAATVEDRRLLGAGSPILRRLLDAYGGGCFPAFFAPALHHLYILTALARGCTGFGDEYRDGWVIAALRPLNHAVELLRIQAERGALNGQETRLLANARGLAEQLLPGVEALQPSPDQWAAMSGVERSLIWERLGVDEEGQQMHPLPSGHSFRAEQDSLGHYSLPGWEQKRGLPHYVTFEHADGKSRTGEEFKCNSGQTETEWDAANVPAADAGRRQGEEGKAAAQEQRRDGGLLPPSRHIRLPRDAEGRKPAGRIRRALHAAQPGAPPQIRRLRQCLRPSQLLHAPGARLLQFHYAKAGAEVHKCGPSNATDFYDELRWVNTSAVESVNSFLKRFRTLGWYSGLESFMIFLPILLSGYNVDLRRVDDAKLTVALPARLWSAAVRRLLLQ